ncbi:alkanal monooxygenase alpha chain [Abditibacteriota bacterium]|nr:alkanal monooxygenase alpha chain [Abditibacteriota bacterium]
MPAEDFVGHGGVPFSILDLAPITQGSDARVALNNSLDLARHAEQWGYRRYWVAEHHNMPGIASSATAVVIGHIAGGTESIRVGSGGVMLPNHVPLVVAEQFGTLETLYPGRIDLGLGRAPGTDQLTMRALRRDLPKHADSFPQDVRELQGYLATANPGQRVRAVPGTGTEVPIWLLGSSVYSASLAAQMGLPFAFAAHFSPDLLLQALDIYRHNFEPSEVLSKPYAMVVANVFAADSDTEARRLFTSIQQSFVNLRRGAPGQLPPPLEGNERPWADYEQDTIDHALAFSFVGVAETIRDGLQNLINKTGADELMLAGMIYDHGARLRSFELVAQVCKQLEYRQNIVAA